MARALRPDIAEARKHVGFLAWKSHREVVKLEEYLRPTEQVVTMAAGIYGGGGGLVALTNQRLIFIKDGWFSKTSQDFTLARLSSIEWHSGLLWGKLIVFGDGEPDGVLIEKVWNASGKLMSTKLRNRTGQQGYYAPTATAPASSTAAQPVGPTASDAILDRLQALEKMKDTLGAARYETLKERILRGE